MSTSGHVFNIAWLAVIKTHNTEQYHNKICPRDDVCHSIRHLEIYYFNYYHFIRDDHYVICDIIAIYQIIIGLYMLCDILSLNNISLIKQII